MTYEMLTALRRETETLSAVLHDLEPAHFDLPTNCPPWNLRELVVHIAASIRVGDTSFPAADPQDEPRGAADYYRRPERDTSSYRQSNVDQTMRLAETVIAEATAVAWFDEVAGSTIAALTGRDLDQMVIIPGRGAMRLADWVTTRVVSVAAPGWTWR